MSNRRPTGTTSRRWLARRLLVVLALALAMTVAGAAAALAAPGHSSGKRQPAVHKTTSSTADKATADEGPASGNGSSPMVVLVFAGIVILAASSPWMPHSPRSGYYRVDRHW